MSLLSIKNLTVSIHGTTIISDVNLSLNAGRTLGIIGESGSGKSMTAFAIMQLLPRGAHASGALTVDGFDMLAASEEALCGVRGNTVSIVFQEPMTALNPLKTIGEQVAEAVSIHEPTTSRKDALQRAAVALARCELPVERFPLTLYPHELSGGQRQRVAIALAITLQPKLLIADEPTTALDVTTQAEILTLLKRLVVEDGMGLVLISHDLAVVADMADDIAIMKDGVIVEIGKAEAFFENIRHPYSKALYAASAHVPSRNSARVEAPLLTVREVIRDYQLPRSSFFSAPKKSRAVDHVSFDILKGESLGLVGESGCGKSTLARAILGLETVQGGAILFDGRPVTSTHGNPKNPLMRMQVVFQDPYGSFNPRHRVDRLIGEPFHMAQRPLTGREKREAITEVLHAVGLKSGDQFKYIHEFSGGQRQRIAIARALVCKPSLILLDEATSALDVSIRAQILDLLAKLAEEHHLTYLFISHDLSVVRAITDRVLIMKSGKIVEQGPTQTVFQSPQHPYTQKLIAAAPVLPR